MLWQFHVCIQKNQLEKVLRSFGWLVGQPVIQSPGPVPSVGSANMWHVLNALLLFYFYLCAHWFSFGLCVCVLDVLSSWLWFRFYLLTTRLRKLPSLLINHGHCRLTWRHTVNLVFMQISFAPKSLWPASIILHQISDRSVCITGSGHLTLPTECLALLTKNDQEGSSNSSPLR